MAVATRELRVSPDLSLPESTITSTLIVFGGKGMGKTNFGSVLVEELTASGLRWCVLDPLGVWWGLRHSADGNDKGIECLILGGVHGDIPIEPTGGAVVADLVVDEEADVLIDVSRRPDGQLWSKGDRIRFVTDYALRIYQRQGELVGGQRRPPFLQVLDEAARYIPQLVRSGDRDVARCVGAWEDLSEEGRNVGIGIVLLTQRSARINKSVSELADAMFAFRSVGPLSLDAITDWLGAHVAKERIRSVAERVRELEVGQALVVSPGWLHFEDVVRIRPRQTFDSSATPKPGEVRRVTGAGAKPDLSKYETRMAETIERAKEQDPGELRKRIRKLEDTNRVMAEAIQQGAGAKVETVEKVVEVPVLDGQVQELRAVVSELRQIGEGMILAGTGLAGVADNITAAIARVGSPPATPSRGAGGSGPRGVARPPASAGQPGRAATAPTSRQPAPRIQPAPRASGEASAEGVKLKAGARRMVEALAWLHPTPMTRSQVGTLAKVQPGGTFSSYLSALRMAELVDDVDDGLLALTSTGVSFAGDAIGRAAPTTDELVATWRSHVKAGAARMLDVLVGIYPDGISRNELAAQADVQQGGTFSSYLSSLRRNGLVSEGSGMVFANSSLFLGGR